MSRVLLISAPWRNPNESDLAVATLQGILQRDGFHTDVLHGSHLMPRTRTPDMIRSVYSSHFFAPLMDPRNDESACLDAVLDDLRESCVLDGVRLKGDGRLADYGIDEVELRAQLYDDFRAAEQCIDACVHAALEGDYDVIGLSCTFEIQLTAALTIARRVRAAAPHVRLMMGGAVCFGQPASELMAYCSALDAVCYTEGDVVITGLARALCGNGVLTEVPGVVVRQGAQLVRTEKPTLVSDLDWLPEPDYAPFMEALGRSPWSDRPPVLFFETSRGCWWGEKHLCSFCALGHEGLVFRKKSPDRAVGELIGLWDRYPSAALLHCSDNILDRGYLKSVMPRLAAHNRNTSRPLRMFWEVKANLKADEVQVLADAGTVTVQPGIESFDDHILTLMDKGATGLGQVQAIRRLAERGVGIVYNMIIMNPGETAADYRAMTALVPYLEHLPPPRLGPLWLERFSPLYDRPEVRGLRNIRPKAHYSVLFPSDAVNLDGLAYVFDFDHDLFDDQDLKQAHRAFAEAVEAWGGAYTPKLLAWEPSDLGGLVTDRREARLRRRRVTGASSRVLSALEGVRGRRGLARSLPELDPEILDAQLAVFTGERWVCTDTRGRTVSVIPRRDLGAANGLSAVSPRSADAR